MTSPSDPVPELDLGGLPGPGAPVGPTGDERRDRRRALGRLAAMVVVLGLAAWFVAENTHRVTVHLWLVDRTMALVWVIAGCLVVGLAVGYWIGWQGHRRAAERRAARALGRRRRNGP